MPSAGHTSSLAILVLTILFIVESAQTTTANYFSRIIDFDPDAIDETDSKAPSGAAASMGSEAQVGSMIKYKKGVLYATLANNNKIPLIGVGVGNSPHEYVGALVSDAIQDDKKIRLVDTAHASHNEDLVAEGIVHGVQMIGNVNQGRVEVHVVTKVWYTHLGYERTKLSVQDSIRRLQPAIDDGYIDLKLHILLHWPRCYDTIPWMECEKEEEVLSSRVKKAGPNPGEDPDNAWKASWKALEDLYLSDQYPIESIGLANFHLHDIESMDSFARIHPHVLQVHIWSLLYDGHLVDYCHRRRIHVQVYNAVSATVMQPERAPRAYRHILKIAKELSEETGTDVTAGQVILGWLIQHGVSVIPRTARLSRLRENSVTALAELPGMTDSQVETVAHSVEAYLSGDDLEKDIHVSVTFHVVSKDIMLYWRGKNGEEVRIAHVKRGETFQETTYPNHTFRTYDASNKDIFIDHEIQANFGDHKDIHVEL